MSYPSEFVSVFARNCVVRRIDSVAARAFLERNHRYGFSRCGYCYGLFVERQGHDGRYVPGDLVAVSCFSKPRHREEEGRRISSYEWVRYASLEGVRVSGGMGKMLKAFIGDRHPDDVMTYAPLQDGTEGDVYAKLGFVREGVRQFGQGMSAVFRYSIGIQRAIKA